MIASAMDESSEASFWWPEAWREESRLRETQREYVRAIPLFQRAPELVEVVPDAPNAPRPARAADENKEQQRCDQ